MKKLEKEFEFIKHFKINIHSTNEQLYEFMSCIETIVAELSPMPNRIILNIVEKLTSITIEIKSKTIASDKHILADRCEKLKNFLINEMNKNEEDQIKIENKQLQEMLKYFQLSE